MGIPADVTVRLTIVSVASIVTDPFSKAITGADFAFRGTGINRSSISRNCQVFKIDQILGNGFVQEVGFEDVKETFCRGKILWRFNFESYQRVIYRHFLNRIGFFLLFLAFRLNFWGMDRIENVVLDKGYTSNRTICVK